MLLMVALLYPSRKKSWVDVVFCSWEEKLADFSTNGATKAVAPQLSRTSKIERIASMINKQQEALWQTDLMEI